MARGNAPVSRVPLGFCIDEKGNSPDVGGWREGSSVPPTASGTRPVLKQTQECQQEKRPQCDDATATALFGRQYPQFAPIDAVVSDKKELVAGHSELVGIR